MVEDALRFPGEAQEGMRAICGREIQKSLKDSAKHLIETKIAEYGLREADGRASDWHQQCMPVTVAGDSMGDLGRAERLAVGARERVEQGFFQRWRGQCRIG